MARLGPFEAQPGLAVAVSGGADSLALAVLARDWATALGGSLTALVVDHGLRPESEREADLTLRRLAGIGIRGRKLSVLGLRRGPALAARARAARYAALAAACGEMGLVHLLVGHHAGDQAETLRMRAGASSGTRGMAGMAAMVETREFRVLRPLLAVPPGWLRDLLRSRGIDWVEDPSNTDPASLRARLRAELADPRGDGPGVAALVAQSATLGAVRAAQDSVVAAHLAARVRLHPEGWAVLSGGTIDAVALGALLRTVAGRDHAPDHASLFALAARPRAATLGGTRILPAGRAGAPGEWLVVREIALMEAPIAALPGVRWDSRFQLGAITQAGLMLGALGADAARLRRSARSWPAAALATLPALRRGADLVAVPHLGWPSASACRDLELAFTPPSPMACAPFRPLVGTGMPVFEAHTNGGGARRA